MSKKLTIFQSQLLPIEQLEPNKGQIPGVPKNPRKRDDAQMELLKKSIQEDPEMLGLRDILVYPVGDKFVAIGGNMRLEALQALGYTEAICRVIPEGTPAKKLKAIAIKDNNSFGEWDFELLRIDWSGEPLGEWGLNMSWGGEEGAASDGMGKTSDDVADDDYDGEVPKDAKSRLGDIYELGNHRLICGDSTKEATLSALMGEEVADLWLTDPPYNVAYESKSNGKTIQNDDMEDTQFLEFLTAAFTAASGVLKPGGAFYIWHADSEGYNFRTACKKVDLRVRQCLIWNKNSLVLGRQDYQWKHEPCLYGWKDGAGHYFCERRDLTTVIDENKPQRSEEHPTMKPVKLIARQIENSTRPGELVLDTFGGSGTTLIAAEQLGRRCFMVELDPHYVDVIIKRWEDLTGLKAKLIHRGK